MEDQEDAGDWTENKMDVDMTEDQSIYSIKQYNRVSIQIVPNYDYKPNNLQMRESSLF